VKKKAAIGQNRSSWKRDVPPGKPVASIAEVILDHILTSREAFVQTNNANIIIYPFSLILRSFFVRL